MPLLSEVLPIPVPAVRGELTDLRTQSSAEQVFFWRRWRKEILRFQTERPHLERHPIGICNENRERAEEIKRRWIVYKRVNPDRDFAEFEREKRTRVNAWDQDDDLPFLSLALLVGRNSIQRGGIHISNVVPATRGFQAIIIPGMPDLGPLGSLTVWAETISAIISRPIRHTDGTMTNITEYIVPDGQGTQYRENLHPGVSEFFDVFEANGLTVLRRADGTPFRVRR